LGPIPNPQSPIPCAKVSKNNLNFIYTFIKYVYIPIKV
jgi:hypothetical protein